MREIEHGSFTPLILYLTGGMGKAATVFCHSFLQETRFADCYKMGAALHQHIILAEMLIGFCASEVCNPKHQGGSFPAGRQMLPPMDLVAAETNFSA